MFNTSFSYYIFDQIPKEIQKIMKKRDNAEKYDYLLGLTRGLSRYSTLKEDFEDSAALQSLLTKLGNAWKKLLTLSDAELGIDGEFTRPATMKILEDWANDLPGISAYYNIKIIVGIL